MCYDSNARPPNPPGTPGQATGQDLELVSSDGTHFAAYIARAALGQPAKANIVIYPDAGGLDRFYKELALRFAEQGIDAIALDTTGVEHEIVIYPGAPHSFFDRKFTEYAQESADAWRRILGFVGKYTK